MAGADARKWTSYLRAIVNGRHAPSQVGAAQQEELEMLAAADYAPRNLGPLTLRTETAVLAGATRLLQGPTG